MNQSKKETEIMYPDSYLDIAVAAIIVGPAV